jgi:2-oxoglutarate ferredoxin oxidoreductase subunit gamma
MAEKAVDSCHKVMFAGTGGKGVLTVGRLLAESGLAQYRYSSFFPNYGAAQRGGDAECTVILSHEELDSPVQFNIPAAVVMDISVFKQFEERVQPDGALFVDSTVIPDRCEREDIRVFYIPATRMASELGSSQVANLILLGAYLEHSGAVPIPVVEKALELAMKGGRREALIQVNKEALNAGARAIREYAEP